MWPLGIFCASSLAAACFGLQALCGALPQIWFPFASWEPRDSSFYTHSMHLNWDPPKHPRIQSRIDQPTENTCSAQLRMSIGAALPLESQPRHGYPSHSILLNRFALLLPRPWMKMGIGRIWCFSWTIWPPKKEGLDQLPLETNLTMGCLPLSSFSFP